MTPHPLLPAASAWTLLAIGGVACTSPATTPAAQGTANALASGSDAASQPCPPASAAFCWVNPQPQGSTLAGAWLSGADDGWAVGPLGSMLHWNGSSLASVAVPALAPLRAVWGSAANDVWAVGDVVLHYDGSSWAVAAGVPAAPWNAVHGTSADDVWLVGTAGAVAHCDGRGWSRLPVDSAGDLSAVAAAGPGDVYAATASGGTIFHWDGSAWSVAVQLAARSLAALFSAAPGDVWAAGEALDVNAASGARGTALAHGSAGSWQATAVPGLETAEFTALAGTSSNDVWALAVTGAGAGAAAHLDGAGWHVEPLPSPALAPRAVSTAAGVVLAAGDGGQAFVRAAGTWHALHHGVPGYLQSAAVAGTGEVWFAGVLPGAAEPEAQLLHVAGGVASAVPVGVADVVYGVWANGPADVWAGTLQNGFLHFDGSTWTARVGGYAGLVDGVWASGPSDAWGVAGSQVVHFDGSSISRLPLPGGGARRIFGISSRDIWAVGGSGVVQHWDGAAWSALPITGVAMGVWGSASDDVWMVGEGGLALHWNGQGLARVDAGTSATLWAVAGSGKGDVWVAGAGGTVLHLDGSSFAAVPSGTQNALAAIAVGSPGEVYVGGDFGTILRAPP